MPPYIRSITLLSLFLLSLNIPLQAKSHFDTLPTNTQEDLELLKRIVKNPPLLNPKYLEYYVGTQAAAMTAPLSQSLRSSAPVSRTFWLDRDGNYIRYTFEQSMPNPGKYLAEFSFVLTCPENVLIKDVSKILDEEPTNTIDENGHPAIAYSMDPTLKVFAYQDSHIVNLTRIAVEYAGPFLPPPDKADMDEAIQHRRNAAFEHAHIGRHDKAISLLQSHLQANPNDAEAHLQLADSYKAHSCVNEAITEYKAALANCGDDKKLHDHCIEGLHSLKVDFPDQSQSLPAANITPTNSYTIRERININPPSTPQSGLNSGSTIKPLDVGF